MPLFRPPWTAREGEGGSFLTPFGGNFVEQVLLHPIHPTVFILAGALINHHPSPGWAVLGSG